MSKDEKEEKQPFTPEEEEDLERFFKEEQRLRELLNKRTEEQIKRIKSEIEKDTITVELGKKTRKKQIITILQIALAIIAVLLSFLQVKISPESFAQLQVYLTWAFLIFSSLIIAVFLSMIVLRPLGEFGVFQLIKDNQLKDFAKVSKDEIQVLSFSYFIAIVLLVPAITFTRTALLQEPATIEILDIGIAAFVVFAGRAVFSYRSIIGKLFYTILSFIVIVLYINLLINHAFPSFDYLLLIPTTTTSSIALASAGEKLLKINRIKRKLTLKLQAK